MADQPNEAKENRRPATAPSSVRTNAYLGVAVVPLHESLVAHLEHLLGKGGAGVRVEHVAKNSPAEHAGLRTHDILVTYNDQKLINPESLVRLMHEGKPGQEVTLGIVRAGKHETAKATLGGPADAPQHESAQLPSHADPESMWTSFDKMILTRENDHRFKAQITYEDTSGKMETRSFEGTREQIRKDIEAQKGMPAHERTHLLRALNLSSHPAEVGSNF